MLNDRNGFIRNKNIKKGLTHRKSKLVLKLVVKGKLSVYKTSYRIPQLLILGKNSTKNHFTKYSGEHPKETSHRCQISKWISIAKFREDNTYKTTICLKFRTININFETIFACRRLL